MEKGDRGCWVRDVVGKRVMNGEPKTRVGIPAGIPCAVCCGASDGPRIRQKITGQPRMIPSVGPKNSDSIGYPFPRHEDVSQFRKGSL